MQKRAWEKLPLFLAELMGYYKSQINGHPVITAGRAAELTMFDVRRFAITQFGDCIWWVPMLALIKERVTSPRLRKAAFDNLRCEAGAAGESQPSHIAMCYNMVNALGISNYEISGLGEIAAHRESVTAILSLASESEGVIAGWLLAAEGLVPVMFKGILPAFKKLISENDTEYLTEHVAVDEDQHVQWMVEAVLEVLDSGATLEQVAHGIEKAGNITMGFLDDIHRFMESRMHPTV